MTSVSASARPATRATGRSGTMGSLPDRTRGWLPAAFVGSVAAILAISLPLSPARAGEHRFDVSDSAYRAECGSCHVAYPPRLLGESEWSILLSGLATHFGSDASVDPATLARLRRVLASGAATRRANVAGTTGEPRITETSGFVREHREVAARFRGDGRNRAADCASCHVGAADGDYSERTLRVPR